LVRSGSGRRMREHLHIGTRFLWVAFRMFVQYRLARYYARY
jgi:hypothetical protein